MKDVKMEAYIENDNKIIIYYKQYNETSTYFYWLYDNGISKIPPEWVYKKAINKKAINKKGDNKRDGNSNKRDFGRDRYVLFCELKDFRLIYPRLPLLEAVYGEKQSLFFQSLFSCLFELSQNHPELMGE